MTESHTILDRQLPPSTQEISTLDHNLGTKTGNGGRQSVNPSESVSMPIPETVIQVDQQLPPSITEIHTSEQHDLEKFGTNDPEKGSISIPVPETDRKSVV